MTNSLYFGDNLEIMRERLADASVDLVYLDPPFNSDARYNVLFRSSDGRAAQAQAEAFRDTWFWDHEAQWSFDEIARIGGSTASIVNALYTALGQSDLMAYLVMMSVRLHEIHRIMKPTGSLYLHCDPTASHYLKIILDGVFGPTCYRSEISWRRSTSHGNVRKNYGSLRDVLLYYTKTDEFCWRQQYHQFSTQYLKKYNQKDPNGRRWQSVTLRNPSVRPNLQYIFDASNGNNYEPHPNGWAVGLDRMRKYDAENRLHFPSDPNGQLRLKQYLDEREGVRLQNSWEDIPPINSQAKERLGYPTQKPLRLLERIIETSSRPNDVVFDPFCGCGTTVHAAQYLARRWIGVDVAYHAIKVIQDRLSEHFPLKLDYDLDGIPRDLASARKLAERDKYQFQWWANYLLGVQQMREVKRGPDRGIDGELFFSGGPDQGLHRILTSVKGGKTVRVADVRDFRGVIEREKAAGGVFVCLKKPTRDMRSDAASAGFFRHGSTSYPRLQVLSIEEWFEGGRPSLPNLAPIARRGPTPAKAGKRRRKVDSRQTEMLLTVPGGKSRGSDTIHLNPETAFEKGAAEG